MKHTIWARFPYNAKLLVSIDGTLINLNYNFHSVRRVVKTHKDKKGYHIASIRAKHTNRLQRLVAVTFIPNPDNKKEVNHKDGNKDNNTVENFDWMTTKENIQHAIDNGLRKLCCVAGANRLTEDSIGEIASLGELKPRLSNREIGRRLGIDHATVGKYR